MTSVEQPSHLLFGELTTLNKIVLERHAVEDIYY
jgi:hypothetical protein